MIPSYIHVQSKVLSNCSLLSDDAQSYSASHRRVRVTSKNHLPQDQSKWQRGGKKRGDVAMKLPHRCDSQKSIMSLKNMRALKEEEEEKTDEVPETISFVVETTPLELGSRPGHDKSSLRHQDQRLSLQEDALVSYCGGIDQTNKTRPMEDSSLNADNDRPPRKPRRRSN